MKLSKVISHLENMVTNLEHEAQKKANVCVDEDGTVNVESLVNDVFMWNMGRIAKMQEEARCYKELLTTLKDSDWDDLGEGKMSLTTWFDAKKEKYRDLAMSTPSRGSQQGNNLISDYQREAHVEVFRWMADLEEYYNGIELDS